MANLKITQDHNGKLAFHMGATGRDDKKKAKKKLKFAAQDEVIPEDPEKTRDRKRRPTEDGPICAICEEPGHTVYRCEYKKKVNTLIRERKISLDSSLPSDDDDD